MLCTATGLDYVSDAETYGYLLRWIERAEPELPRLPFGSSSTFSVIQGQSLISAQSSEKLSQSDNKTNDPAESSRSPEDDRLQGQIIPS